MEDRESTLSKRGAELASGPNMRDQASQILGKQWHPIDNPDALVNIGTAENVGLVVPVCPEWHSI